MVVVLQKKKKRQLQLRTTARHCLQHFLAVELNNMLYLAVCLADGIFAAIDLINTSSQNIFDRTASS